MKDLYKFDLQLFNDGGDPPPADPQPDPNQDPGLGDAAITFPDEKSFMARVARETRKQQEASAKALGYESVEAMQEALKAAQAAKDKNKTDLEKEKEAREAAEKAATVAQTKANLALIRADFKLKAKEAGAVNPDSAFKLADMSDVEVDDEGNVTGVDDVVKALKESDPYLFGKTTGGGIGGSANPGGGDPPPEESMGEKLGKARAEQAKKHADSRNHYFK